MGPHPSGPLVKIAEVMDDNRLRVSMDSQGMNSRIVSRAKKLQEIVLRSGDEVRMDPSFKLALEHFGAKENREYFLEEIKPISLGKSRWTGRGYRSYPGRHRIATGLSRIV